MHGLFNKWPLSTPIKLMLRATLQHQQGDFHLDVDITLENTNVYAWWKDFDAIGKVAKAPKYCVIVVQTPGITFLVELQLQVNDFLTTVLQIPDQTVYIALQLLILLHYLPVNKHRVRILQICKLLLLTGKL